MAVKLNPFGAVSFTFNRSRFNSDIAREIRRLESIESGHRAWIDLVLLDLANRLLKLAIKYCPTDTGKLQLSGKVVKGKTRAGFPRYQIIFDTPYAGIVHDFWIPPLGGFPWAAEVGKYGKNSNKQAKAFFLEQATEELNPIIIREMRKAVEYAQRNP